MVLGISEDFSTNVILDSELTSASTTGLNLNSCVHPSVTVDNLLEFLPNSDIVFQDWDIVKSYAEFNNTKKRSDIVTYNDVLYQSLKSDNVGNQPDEANSIYWLETNIESLTLKSFIEKVKDKVYSDLNLNKRLVNSQFIYEVGRHDYMLPNQYNAYVFEPKGSD